MHKRRRCINGKRQWFHLFIGVVLLVCVQSNVNQEASELSGTLHPDNNGVGSRLATRTIEEDVSMVSSMDSLVRFSNGITNGRKSEDHTWKEPSISHGHEREHVTVLKFQMDSIMSDETVASINATWPDLKNITVCLWVNIYYWRHSIDIFSYALDVDRDNVLLMTATKRAWGIQYGDIFLQNNRKECVAYEMEWGHSCVLISSESITIYIDGHKEFRLLPEDLRNKPALPGKGVLVLGQDQDIPGGGYDATSSFSGAIADFQLFSDLLTEAEVTSLLHCQDIQKEPLLTLHNPDWHFTNISEETMPKASLCAKKSHGNFFLFTTMVDFDKSSRNCETLGGNLVTRNEVHQMLRALKNAYFNTSEKEFIGLNIHFRLHAHQVNEESYDNLRITWEPNGYTNATARFYGKSSVKEYPYVCNIKKQGYIRLLGVPTKIEYLVDKRYKLFVKSGKNILRGIKQSYLEHDGQWWCLKTIRSTAVGRKTLLCLSSLSDYPPLGRKKWRKKYEAGTVEILLTSCKEHFFTCDSGDCIPLNQRCDKSMECLDESDEEKCGPLPLYYERLRFGNTSPPKRPVQIKGTVLFTNIPAVNLETNSVSANMWLNLSWSDQRSYFLNLQHDEEVLLKEHYFMYYVWGPQVILKPLKKMDKKPSEIGSVVMVCNGEPKVYGTIEEMAFSSNCSEVWRKFLYHVSWQCEFDIRRFPFENIECPLFIELEDNQTWKNIHVTLQPVLHLPYKVSLTNSSASGSLMSIKLLFTRQSAGYFVTTFFPLMLLTGISGFTFFFRENDFTNRVMVTLSTLIVVASLSAQMVNTLPNTSYTKCIDVVFLSTIAFQSLVFMCHVVCSVIWRRRKQADVASIIQNGGSSKLAVDGKGKVHTKINLIAACLCIFAGIAFSIMTFFKCF